MSNKNSKAGDSGFVLNDMVKRKILEMYKISKKETSENDDNSQNSKSSSSNSKTK